MANTNVTKEFANRLRDAMIRAGFSSQRSTSGVSIHKLTEITGYSVQICRKYLRGEAMPEFSKLMDIATALRVSPGWLAFGDSSSGSEETKTKVIISKESLRYIFMKAACLPDSSSSREESSVFLMELVNAISLINGTEDQNKQIIDLALSSGKYFRTKL
jgi:transcriptional regulator with XRE-family HTH domain